MHLFISYFKKSPAFFLSCLFVLIFETILHFIPNLYYLEGTGSFFVYYKREIIENKNLNYDILLLGDSRSLSLMGIKGEEGKPSLYNLSLPAAGPWYYKYLLKKYLKYHSKPKLVVWAADANILNKVNTQKFNLAPDIWSQYKHRLINLFTYSETFEQYDGMELFFISKEYLKESLYSVRFRQALETILTSRPASLLKGDSQLLNRNKLVASIVEKSNGQINLGDFFFAPEGYSEKENKKFLEFFSKGEINSEPFINFLEFCKQEKIPVVVLKLPQAMGIHSSYLYREEKKMILESLKDYTDVKYMEFNNMEYPLNYFGESIHFSTAGEKVLNKEFIEIIYPNLIEVMNHAEK